MSNFKQIFERVSNDGIMYLVDADTPLKVFYGINSKNQYEVTVIAPYKGKIPELSTCGLEVKQTYDGKRYYTKVCLIDLDFIDTFYVFCDSLIDSISGVSDEEEAYAAFLSKLISWKKMFTKKKHFLSDEEVQGYYGELYFLDNYIFPKLGFRDGLKAWSGPEGTSKDFSTDQEWFEVKTTGMMSEKVKISSVQQLASENYGHLIIIRAEKVAEGFKNGIGSLNDLFKKICFELKNQPELEDAFIDKLEKIGYAYDVHYDTPKFSISSMNFYLVNEKFPKITSAEDYGEAIADVSYALLINALAKFLEKKDI